MEDVAKNEYVAPKTVYVDMKKMDFFISNVSVRSLIPHFLLFSRFIAFIGVKEFLKS